MNELLEWMMANPWWSVLIAIGSALIILILHDTIFQKKHTILHNYPIVGHLRYLLELIGPELRQYWVAHDKEEMPFNRAERRWVYATAKNVNNNFGFGTTEQLYETGYPIIKHAAFPFPESKAYHPYGDPSAIPCLKIIGKSHGRKKPWRPPSIVNIAAMSFGSLGRNATAALNQGAKLAGCFHNTGEGGPSSYHNHGADLVWQLGTGYFGARDEQGNFSMDLLIETAQKMASIRMIEIKLSQGAKPGKGGILPGKKVTAEIAAIRKIPKGKDCISPNGHVEFENVDGLIEFIERIAGNTGLPVGIKSAVGNLNFWDELAQKMKHQNAGPDFINIDGAEGGTGAAPLAFSDHVALPFKTGFARVYAAFQREGLTNDVAFFGAGKLGFPDRAVVAMSMGVDVIMVAREAMIAIGCIQAQKCHTGHCPAGVATMNRWLEAGLNVPNKAQRAANYIKGFRKEMLNLTHAAGYEHPGQFSMQDIEISRGLNRYHTLAENLEYDKTPVPFGSMQELF